MGVWGCEEREGATVMETVLTNLRMGRDILYMQNADRYSMHTERASVTMVRYILSGPWERPP